MVWPSARSTRHEIGEQREGVAERVELDDLAADMHVDADDAHAVELGGAGIDLARAADRNAELVLRLAGRDLGVGLWVDVGIDADRDVGGAALAGRDRRQKFELRFRLDIDAENAVVDGERELARGLADAGEHDLLRRDPGGARAQQFAFGDHVGAGAEPGERRDHRLVGVGLERIADERVDIGKGAGEHPVVPLQGRARIAVERRADRLGQRDQIDGLGAAARRRDRRSDAWRVFRASAGRVETGLRRGMAAIDDWDRKRRPPRRRRIAGRYCSSGSSRNGFFWPGVAAGLPCESKPVLAMVSCEVGCAADASAGAEATGPGGGALKAAGAG